MIPQLQGKLILGSLAKTEIPQNLHDFNANLVQQEYQLINEKSNKKTHKSKLYIEFKHKKKPQQNFKILFNSFKQPASLIHLIKMQQEKVQMLPKINRICTMQVKRDFKKQQKVQEKIDLQDSDQEPMDLIIQQFYDKDSYSVSKQPSVQLNVSQLKTLIIQLIKNTPQGVSSIKQVRQRLQKQQKRKFSQKICDNNPQKRTRSYVLKEIYQNNDYSDGPSYGLKGRKLKKGDYNDD